ncbi:MAG: peptide chain release factor N(5)-glutamine methyltransferase [Oscillospiraceae bacterium]
MVNKTARQLYEEACKKLKIIEPNSYSFEVSQILEFVVGVTRLTLPIDGQKIVDNDKVEIFESILEKRLAHQPLQYLLGEWEFYGLPIKVGEGVLIPRPDTEIVAETAIKIINDNSYKNVVDLCSGSGAIAIAIAANTNADNIFAVELSNEAFPYLKENVLLNHFENKISPILADGLKWQPKVKLDLIVCNPPYIPNSTIPTLDEEVLNEPMMALDGGDDGMDFYRKFAEIYYQYLNQNGALVFEVGIDQSGIVSDILKNNSYRNITTSKDMLGIERCVVGIK